MYSLDVSLVHNLTLFSCILSSTSDVITKFTVIVGTFSLVSPYCTSLLFNNPITCNALLLSLKLIFLPPVILNSFCVYIIYFIIIYKYIPLIIVEIFLLRIFIFILYTVYLKCKLDLTNFFIFIFKKFNVVYFRFFLF